MASDGFKKVAGLIGVGLISLGYIGWRKFKKCGRGLQHIDIASDTIDDGAMNDSTSEPIETVSVASDAVEVPEPESTNEAADSGHRKSSKPRKVPEAQKTKVVSDIFTALKEQNDDEFTIRFGQSKKRGYRGYYVSGMTDASVFVGWSDEFEEAYALTPYWIELDKVATARYKESGGIDRDLDIYPHPAHADSMLVAVGRKMAANSAEVASVVLDIARATVI